MPRALFRIAPLRAVLLLFATVFLLGVARRSRASPCACRSPDSTRWSGRVSRCASA